MFGVLNDTQIHTTEPYIKLISSITRNIGKLQYILRIYRISDHEFYLSMYVRVLGYQYFQSTNWSCGCACSIGRFTLRSAQQPHVLFGTDAVKCITNSTCIATATTRGGTGFDPGCVLCYGHAMGSLQVPFPRRY